MTQTPIFPLISIQRTHSPVPGSEFNMIEKVIFSTRLRKQHNGVWYQFLVIKRQLNSTFGPNWEIAYIPQNDNQYQTFICECYKALLLTDVTFDFGSIETVEIYKEDTSQISEYDRVLELVERGEF